MSMNLGKYHPVGAFERIQRVMRVIAIRVKKRVKPVGAQYPATESGVHKEPVAFD
jgi:hypothetical protein